MANPIHGGAHTATDSGLPAAAPPDAQPQTCDGARVLETGHDSRPKKLLVFSHPAVTAINQSFFADVAESAKWSVDLVLPANWNTEYRQNVGVERWPGFRGALHAIPVWKPGNIPLHLYRSSLVKLLRKVQPDAIYVHHEPYGLATAQIYLANRLTGNCPIGFYAAQNILKDYPPPFRWFEKFVFQNTSFAFPVTEGALQVLRTKGYQGDALVLPLAIDRSVYYPRGEWATEKRKELRWEPDEFVIGYLGRFVEEKGLTKLLRALTALGDGPWRCLLIGSGPQEAELRALADELGLGSRVQFAGFVLHPEVPSWLSLFDVLVLASESRPHWKEQFGRVITEANACGTAVIGTDSGEIGHVLRSTQGGLLVPENDVPALGSALRRLWHDAALRQSLAAQGLAAVTRQYDQHVLAAQFVSAIQNFIPARS